MSIGLIFWILMLAFYLLVCACGSGLTERKFDACAPYPVIEGQSNFRDETLRKKTLTLNNYGIPNLRRRQNP